MLCANQASELLSFVLTEEGVKLKISDEDLILDTDLAPSGFLPLICQKAEIKSIEVTGRGLGFKYIPENESLLGFKVEFEDGYSSAERIAYLVDVLLDFVPEDSLNKTVDLSLMMN